MGDATRDAQQPANGGDAGSGPAAKPEIPWRFLLLFGVYLVVFTFGLDLSIVQKLVTPWTEANAVAATAVTGLFGYDSRAEGMMMYAGGTSLSVAHGCNGVHAVLIFASAVLAFPVRWSRRLIGLAAGIVVIFGFNIIRLINLLLVAIHYPARLELFHIYIWQTLIVLLAFGTFLVWGMFFAGKD